MLGTWESWESTLGIPKFPTFTTKPKSKVVNLGIPNFYYLLLWVSSKSWELREKIAYSRHLLQKIYMGSSKCWDSQLLLLSIMG